MNNKAMREIFDRCEFCHNSSDVMYFKDPKFGIQKVVGDYIAYELIGDNGQVIAERCDNHFSEEECKENPNWRIIWR